MELLFAHFPVSSQMLMEAKEDLALVFVAPFDEESEADTSRNIGGAKLTNFSLYAKENVLTSVQFKASRIKMYADLLEIALWPTTLLHHLRGFRLSR